MSTSALPISVMRGGTSRGVFTRLGDLPTDRGDLDALACALLGSPDPLQVDGLGGGRSSTSKVMAVGTPAEAAALGHTTPADCEVAYLFGQVPVEGLTVDWSGNCGNLTSAVAQYALLSGIISAASSTRKVRLFNLNTSKRVDVTFQVRAGAPLFSGDYTLAGVRGTGSRVDVEFLDPAGSMTSSLFPTGHLIDTFEVGTRTISATLSDIGTPAVAVRAASLGLAESATVNQWATEPGILPVLETVRREAGVRMGLADTLQQVPAGAPRIMVVGAGVASGRYLTLPSVMVSMGRVHHAFPGTGLASLAALARIPGTVVGGASTHSGGVAVQHLKGIGHADADVSGPERGARCEVRSVTVPRTARLLVTGLFHL